MKVIKDLKRKDRGTIRETCTWCNAILDIEASDLLEEPCKKPESYPIFSYYCPCCRHKHYIHYRELPPDFLVELKKSLTRIINL